MQPLNGLGDVLGIDYEAVEQDIVAKHEEIKEIVGDGSSIIADKEYLRRELKELIENTKNVMNILEGDIRIGAQPRTHEVYATLVKTAVDAAKELREMHEADSKLKLSEMKMNTISKRFDDKKSQNSDKSQVGIVLTITDLQKMITTAKDNSEMHSIDAEFNVVDETLRFRGKKQALADKKEKVEEDEVQ